MLKSHVFTTFVITAVASREVTVSLATSLPFVSPKSLKNLVLVASSTYFNKNTPKILLLVNFMAQPRK